MAREALKKRFANFFSRTAVRVRNNLGVVMGDEREGVRKVRNKELEIYDSYAESTQYDKLPRWDEIGTKDSEFVPVRKRQPRIIFNFAKVLTDRMAAKLVGDNAFLDMKIEDDEDDDAFIEAVLKISKLKQRMLPATRLLCLSGSSFLRFQLIEGVPMLETYHSKYCYPEFTPTGQLKFIKIMYVFEDEDERDGAGNFKKKWFRLDLGQQVDVVYDTPDYQLEAQPQFQIVDQVQHNLGFVQGHWFRTEIDKHSPDGPSLIADILDFIDELNYNLSQSSAAVGYNQEPLLAIKGLADEEMQTIIRSSAKALALGKDGEAKFVETTLDAVKVASELRDKVRMHIQDVARILLLDPEKVVGHAQSGKAMEVLHGPMIELINELRPVIEEGSIELVQKIGVALLVYAAQGFETAIEIPPGYKPKSMDIVGTWPEIFPMTLDDMFKKAQTVVALTTAEIYSREWGTNFMAKDVGVENVDEELSRLASQVPIMPFGADPSGGFGGPSNEQK